MTSENAFRRDQAPGRGPIRPFHVPPVQVEQLENGLELRAARRSSVPLVSVTVTLDAGETRVPAGMEGLAVLTGNALLGGTRRLSATELAESFDRLGSGLHISTNWDATTVSFTCMAERAGDMLGLAGQVLSEPAFPEGEVARVRDQQVAGIRQGRKLPARLASDSLNAAMFAATEPYHRPISGIEAVVESMTRDNAEAFRAGRFTPRSTGLAVVGDLSADQVIALAHDRLGAWAGGEAAAREARDAPSDVPTDAPAAAPAGGRTARRVIVVDRPGAVQSEIRVGHAGPARGHPSEIPLRVANTVLGGAFTSRLNMSLREKHGFTYGVRSSFAFYRRRGKFTVGTAVQTEVTVAALREMMEVIEAFATEGPTAEELPRARDYLAGVLPLQMETASQLAARLAGTIIFGLPPDYYQTYRERIRAVDLPGAVAAVRSHVVPGELSIVVVGDAGRVADEIGALRLGDVEVIDP